MQLILGHEKTARLTLEFLRDHVGIRPDDLAGIAAMDQELLTDILSGEPCELAPGQVRRIEVLATIQSMLLSSYTPAGAAAWMRTPTSLLGGLSPRELLLSGEQSSTHDILSAAVRRVGA